MFISFQDFTEIARASQHGHDADTSYRSTVASWGVPEHLHTILPKLLHSNICWRIWVWNIDNVKLSLERYLK